MAAHLVDRVFPEVPVRQWVLSLPHRLRFLCAYRPEVCRGVRRILVRAVSGFYERRAAREGVGRPRAGAVVFDQRFDSALRVDLHFHGLWPDGVFACAPEGAGRFHDAGRVTDGDVARIVRRVRNRVLSNAANSARTKYSTRWSLVISIVVELLTKEPNLPTLEVLHRARLSGYSGGKSALYDLVRDLRPPHSMPMVRLASSANTTSASSTSATSTARRRRRCSTTPRRCRPTSSSVSSPT
jgi:hypothetical protein